MTEKKFTSDRKRSRPVTRQNIFQKNKLLSFFIIIITIIVVISVIIIINPFKANEKMNNQDDTTEEGNPIAIFNTSKGIFKVELYKDIAPKTVDNFVKLVNDGFYDGMIFHRISDDFMIQAGKSYPDGTQKTSPYGNIEFEGNGKHIDGAISMASTGAGVGGSAEFFICDGSQSFLDGNYAAFGRVIENISVVRDIADEPHDSSFEPNPGGGKPLENIIINSITIEKQ
jgi:cyclophilin family peptidyl-prolyl cis-trans isomerase